MWGMFDAGGQLATRWKDGEVKVPWQDNEQQKGVVAHCRCWREVGFNGNPYNCFLKCTGANWQQSGTNVCGGKYEYSAAEATVGIVESWKLMTQEKAGFGPVMPDSEFSDQVTQAGVRDRGDCQKSPVRYPGSVKMNGLLNKCSADGIKQEAGPVTVVWTGHANTRSDCTARQPLTDELNAPTVVSMNIA